MKPISLFQKNTTIKAVTVFFISNRFQVIFFLLVFPQYIAHSYMIWFIIALGILSQGNLYILSKWISSSYSTKGYAGFIELFGEWKVRILTAVALLPILVKLSVLTINFASTTLYYIFPSVNPSWLIFVFLLMSMYVAIRGMENTIRFSIIAFFTVIWIILLFLPFYFPPNAAWINLFPLTHSWSQQTWKGILFIWATLSGPEYMICLIPWLKQDQKIVKYMTWANIVTVLELLIVLIASLLFYGHHYLLLIKYPYIEMTRYLQNPIFERIDIVLIAFYLFHLVFMVSILLLILYGAMRIIFKKVSKETTRKGFLITCVITTALIIFLNQFLWTNERQYKTWMNIEVVMSGFTYLFIPSFLVICSKIKRRRR